MVELSDLSALPATPCSVQEAGRERPEIVEKSCDEGKSRPKWMSHRWHGRCRMRPEAKGRQGRQLFMPDHARTSDLEPVEEHGPGPTDMSRTISDISSLEDSQ